MNMNRGDQILISNGTFKNGYVLTKSPNPTQRRPPNTAHDWVAENEKDVADHGTNTFFWRAHTLSVLFLLICVLIYVALIEQTKYDSEYNVKRGLIAVVAVFLLFGVTQTPNGPFKRPHPVFAILTEKVCNRAMLTLPNCRLCILFLTHFDSNLGVPLPEKDYGGNCLIYDSNVSSDPFHNVWDKMDCFVLTHLIGWWLKTLILRDYWLCIVMSIMFEILEYSLEHQLPNFSECWWDHWIMDALICNGLGIYFGMRTMRYLNMKNYNWRSMWAIHSFRGKMKRVAQQFTPYTWMNFEWRPFQSFTRWMAMLGVIFIFLMAELNTFYLKFVLWIPPPHYINLIRLCLFLLAGAVAMRETFQYLNDPGCKRFGRQSWVILSTIVTEFLLIAKCDLNTITKPMPWHVVIFWCFGVLFLIFWTFYNFFLKPIYYVLQEAKMQNVD